MQKNLRLMLFGGPENLPLSSEFGLLLLRVSAGLTLAFAHGFDKIPPGDHGADVAELGVPLPMLAAWLSALAEAVAPLLVAVGLLTRPAALVVAINMAVAFTLAHGGRAFADGEKAFLYLAIMLAIMFVGSGRLSVDRMLR